MKQTKVQVIILVSLLLLGSHSALACKMTAIGGSAQAINAIVNHIAADPQQQDRSIKKITQENSTSWTYIVETSMGDNNCQAASYQAIVDPSCQIKVQPVAGEFVCESDSKG